MIKITQALAYYTNRIRIRLKGVLLLWGKALPQPKHKINPLASGKIKREFGNGLWHQWEHNLFSSAAFQKIYPNSRAAHPAYQSRFL